MSRYINDNIATEREAYQLPFDDLIFHSDSDVDRESFFCSFLIFVEIVYEYTMSEPCNELMKDIYKEIKTQETVHLQCPE